DLERWRGQQVLYLGSFPDRITQLFVTQMQRTGKLSAEKPRKWNPFVIASTDLTRIDNWTRSLSAWGHSEAVARGLYVPLDRPPEPGMPDSLDEFLRMLDARVSGVSDEVRKLLQGMGFNHA